jgi:hypothetical protein
LKIIIQIREISPAVVAHKKTNDQDVTRKVFGARAVIQSQTAEQLRLK